MATKSLLKSSYAKRGSSNRKRFDRRSNRAQAKQALHRAVAHSDFDRDLSQGRTMDRRPRNRCPSDRFLFRLLLKHVDRPWSEVSALASRRVGKSWEASRLLEHLEDLNNPNALYYGGEFWSSWSHDRSIVLYVDEDGVLRRQDHDQEPIDWEPLPPEPPRPNDGWLGYREIETWRDCRSIAERKGSLFWEFWKFGCRTDRVWIGFDEETGENIFEDREVSVDLGRRQVPFSKNDHKIWKRVHPDSQGYWMHS